jgi:hypothetical protein
MDLDDTSRESSWSCADVLYGTGVPERAAALLRRYPGCVLVSLRDAHGRCTTLSRWGGPIVLEPVRSGSEHALAVAMLHQWLVELSRCRAVASGPRPAGRPAG